MRCVSVRLSSIIAISLSVWFAGSLATAQDEIRGPMASTLEYAIYQQPNSSPQETEPNHSEQVKRPATIAELEAQISELQRQLNLLKQGHPLATYDQTFRLAHYEYGLGWAERAGALPDGELDAIAQYRAYALDVAGDEAAQEEQGERKAWIGVHSIPLDSAIRDFVGLEGESGLLIQSVVPDSPAATAGLLEKDILLSANDVSVVELEDLVNSIQEALGGELNLTIYRNGETQRLTVVPEQRPESSELNWHLAWNSQPGNLYVQPKSPASMDVYVPSDMTVAFPRSNYLDSPTATSLPDGVEVTMELDSARGLLFNVTRDGQQQTYAIENFEQMPDDVQVYVRTVTAWLTKARLYGEAGEIRYVPMARGMPIVAEQSGRLAAINWATVDYLAAARGDYSQTEEEREVDQVELLKQILERIKWIETQLDRPTDR